MKKTINAKHEEWLQTPFGQHVLQTELAVLKKLRFSKVADRLLLIGEIPEIKLTESFLTRQVVLLTHHVNKEMDGVVRADPNAIPLPPNSINLALLPHSLDFAKDPSLVLREVNICLQPEGHIVLFGFNPFSLWGIRRLFSIRRPAPWCAKFRSLWRVKDWLAVMNYEIVICKKILYRPPADSIKMLNKLAFLGKILHTLLPFSGSIYCLVAKKKVFGVTPLRPKWKRVRKALDTSPIATNNIHARIKDS